MSFLIAVVEPFRASFNCLIRLAASFPPTMSTLGGEASQTFAQGSKSNSKSQRRKAKRKQQEGKLQEQNSQERSSDYEILEKCLSEARNCVTSKTRQVAVKLHETVQRLWDKHAGSLSVWWRSLTPQNRGFTLNKLAKLMSASQPSHGLILIPEAKNASELANNAETLLGLASERARKGLTKEYEKHDTHVVAQILESKPGGLPTLPYEPDSVFVTSEGETYKMNPKNLSDNDKGMIRRWIETGEAVEGNTHFLQRMRQLHMIIFTALFLGEFLQTKK